MPRALSALVLVALAWPDVVRAANGRRETVRCGGGRDRARVDAADITRGCEQVDRV